jgi:hypothetical protein
MAGRFNSTYSPIRGLMVKLSSPTMAATLSLNKPAQFTTKRALYTSSSTT